MILIARTFRCRLLPFALLLGFAPGVPAIVLYNNTTTDTLDTQLYSAVQPPYTALGDQIHLISAGIANQAEVEMFNNGDAGTFDAELDFFEVGSPVGSSLGSFSVTSISSVGMDVIDITFDLGNLPVPQDLVVTVRVGNTGPNVDLGVDMFEPPTVGSSDNTFMIVQSAGIYSQLKTADENVYFQLSGTTGTSTPEASSLIMLGTSLLVMGVAGWFNRRTRN